MLSRMFLQMLFDPRLFLRIHILEALIILHEAIGAVLGGTCLLNFSNTNFGGSLCGLGTCVAAVFLFSLLG